MDNEKLPIKFFAPREVDDLRIEGNGNSEPPKWLLSGDALVQRSTELLTAFNLFSSIIDNRIARKSAVPFVFIAKMCDDSTAKSRRKDITSLFQTTDRSNVIGLTDSDELIVKIDMRRISHNSSKPFSLNPNYKDINYFVNIGETTQEHHRGPKPLQVKVAQRYTEETQRCTVFPFYSTLDPGPLQQIALFQ